MPGRRVVGPVSILMGTAVVAVAAGAVGLLVLGRTTGAGQAGGRSDVPSLASSVGPGESALPALSGTFTSAFNGFSVSYPEGWKVTKAKQSWPTGSANFSPDDPSVDAFTGPNLAIYAVSQKIDPAVGPAKWLSRYMSDEALDFSTRPDCAVVRTMPIAVDGSTGVMNYSCEAVLIDAVVVAGGRAYVFSLQGDSPDKAWLVDVLKTVKLQPGAAVDARPAPASSTAMSS